MYIFGCAKHDFCLFVLDIGVCFANNATFTGDIFFVNSNFCYNYGCCVPLFLVRLTYCYMYRVTFQTGAWVTGFTMKLMLQLQGDISIGCYNCRVYILDFLMGATITGMKNRKIPYIYGVGSTALGWVPPSVSGPGGGRAQVAAGAGTDFCYHVIMQMNVNQNLHNVKTDMSPSTISLSHFCFITKCLPRPLFEVMKWMNLAASFSHAWMGREIPNYTGN